MSTQPVCPILLQKMTTHYHHHHHRLCHTRHLLVLLYLTDATFLIAKPLCWVVPESATPYSQDHNCETGALCDHHITQAHACHLPTQFLDQGCGIPSDIARKFNSVNAFQNDVVCLHGVRPSKWWRSCEQA
jgi:hypothetical protein